METKIKRGLGIITDLNLINPISKNKSSLLIEGKCKESNIEQDLFCVSNTKKDSTHFFDEIHFNNCENKLLEISGDVELKLKVRSAIQLTLRIEKDANITLTIDGNANEFLSSGLFIQIFENIKVNLNIKSELNGLQNYLRIEQEQEANSVVNVSLQIKSTNQAMLFYKSNIIGLNSVLDKRIFIKAKNSQIDSEVSTIHEVPNTKSNMIVNGTLENSKIINENTITITKEASGVQGFEHSKFIILDDKSNAISIPNLVIFNEDVSCSHGSSISSIDEEELFYLQSRGITKQDSINLITEGLKSQVIDHLNIKTD